MVGEDCPQCGTARTGALRFCRSCGFDFEAPTVPPSPDIVPTTVANAAPPPAPPSWTPPPRETPQQGVPPQPGRSVRPSGIARPGWIPPKGGRGRPVFLVLVGLAWLFAMVVALSPFDGGRAPGPGSATPTPDLLLSHPTVAQAAFEQYGFTLESSPLSDGSPRLVGQDSAQLVLVELIGDPITQARVTAPIPGLGGGDGTEAGTAIGGEAAIFGDPGLTDWVLQEMNALGLQDDDVSATIGGVKTWLQWYPQSLRSFTLTFEQG